MSIDTQSSIPPPHRRYPWTAGLDSILEEGYRQRVTGRRSAIDKIQRLTGWPRQACWDRARKLGLTSRRTSPLRRWSKAEECYLSSFTGSKNVRLIAQKLNRSVAAVRTRLRRINGCSARVRDGVTKTELAKMMGRSPKTIQTWIDQGWLKGRYEENERSDDTFRTPDRDFFEFCKDHPEELLFHRWSREGLEWFLGVLRDWLTTES